MVGHREDPLAIRLRRAHQKSGHVRPHSLGLVSASSMHLHPLPRSVKDLVKRFLEFYDASPTRWTTISELATQLSWSG
jgi:hypothetical protein